MQWNENGRLIGYDFQRPATAGVIIPSTPSARVEKLSRQDTERVKEAVKQGNRKTEKK